MSLVDEMQPALDCSHSQSGLEYSAQSINLTKPGYDLVQLIMVYHDCTCGVLKGSATIWWERLGRANLVAQLVPLAPPTSGGYNKSTRGNNRPITHTRNRPSDFHSQPSS